MLGITLLEGEPGDKYQGTWLKQILLDLQEPYMSC